MTMLVTRGVLAAFYACGMAFAPLPRPSNGVAVHVHMKFDRPVSRAVRRVLEEETAAIWNAYGVELVWSDKRDSAAIRFDVIVGVQGKARRDRRASHAALGVTTIDQSGFVRGPIHLWVDTIESLLDQRDGSNPALHDQELGRALGRVLAHELGHALLGTPSYHDSTGLMRAAFPADVLARIDRWPFELTDRSAVRLRVHVARLAEAQRILTLNPTP
jgi:hypothetical protein